MDPSSANDLARVATRPLDTRWLGRPLVIRAETGSTNDDVRTAALAGASHGYTVVADAQTSGRGRQGRAWESPAGRNLYVSVLLRPAASVTTHSLLALAVGLAVRETVAAFAPDQPVVVKWPNDVRIGARKVAGILAEASFRAAELQWAIVGIGCNVNGRDFPEGLGESATSIEVATGQPVDRAAVLEQLLADLETGIDELWTHGPTRTLASLTSHCETLGQRVTRDEISGFAIAIASDGALLLRDDAGAVHSMHGGEIQSERR